MVDTGVRRMAEVRTLLTGIALGESPRWHEGRVWFCDWLSHEVIAVDPAGDAGGEVVARVPTFPLCIDWLPDGRLLVVAGGERRLLVRAADGTLVEHADLAGLSAHAWNDIAVDRAGNAFVNNIGFDFPGGHFDPGDPPGIIAVVAPDGSVRQVADGLAFPNGMAVTPDGATLIVAESYAARLTAFDIAEDGTLTGRRTWAALDDTGASPAAPDGICLDGDGSVWYADVPNQRCVRVREGGEVLDTIELDRGCFACALGGPDGRTLFMVTADWSDPAAMAGGARTGQLVSVGL